MSLTDIIAKEGDRKEWEYKGYKCLIKRTQFTGALCGYVGLPQGHKYHGKHYDDIEDAMPDLEVHGGLTFADYWREDPNADQSLWWIGFDCAHGGMDVIPNYAEMAFVAMTLDPYSSYKDMEYVTQQCESLVDQIER